MPTHFSLRTFDRLLMNQDGGLPGIPGSGPSQPGPSFEKQPTPLPGTQPLPESQLPVPPPPPGGPVFQQPAPIPPVPAGGGTFELSGWWRRVGATIIDTLILTVPYLIIFVAILGLSFDGTSDSGDGFSIGALILTTLAWVALWFIYAPFLMWKTNGATIGKKATGIRVVRTDGAPMSFGFAMIREVLVKALFIGMISNLTLGLAGLLNYLWPLWDSEHRAGHDMICKTRVVRG
jgi:uncharacterized RDD family membrane protein YckC